MHSYLRSIGFSEPDNVKNRRLLLDMVIAAPDSIEYYDEKNCRYAWYSKEFGPSFGLTVMGQMDEKGNFLPEYHFPYYDGNAPSSREDFSVSKRADSETFSVVIDDPRMDMSMIYFLTNPYTFPELLKGKKHGPRLQAVLTGMALSGKVLLPVKRSINQIMKRQQADIRRFGLLEKAANGDEKAMGALAMDDMATVNSVRQRIHREDLYSIVDTSLIPTGAETDLYAIVGEIYDYKSIYNELTQEEVVSMLISCNDLVFQVVINAKDLIGEPEVRRRFKGTVWMQGRLEEVPEMPQQSEDDEED